MRLFDARNELVEAITATGLNVVGYGPSKIIPPVAVLEEGDPYISEGETIGGTELLINYDVWLFTKNAANDVATEDMDDKLEAVVMSLGGWILTGCQAHFLSQVGDNVYLTSKLSVAKFISIGGS